MLLRQATATFTKDKNSDMENFISWEEVNLKTTADNYGNIISEDDYTGTQHPSFWNGVSIMSV